MGRRPDGEHVHHDGGDDGAAGAADGIELTRSLAPWRGGGGWFKRAASPQGRASVHAFSNLRRKRRFHCLVNGVVSLLLFIQIAEIKYRKLRTSTAIMMCGRTPQPFHHSHRVQEQVGGA